MKNTGIGLTPALVTKEMVRNMLGGMSTTTFWRRRAQWDKAGTPFPPPAPGTNPIRGGEQYRYCDVVQFFRTQGFIDDTQEET